MNEPTTAERYSDLRRSVIMLQGMYAQMAQASPRETAAPWKITAAQLAHVLEAHS